VPGLTPFLRGGGVSFGSGRWDPPTNPTRARSQNRTLENWKMTRARLRGTMACRLATRKFEMSLTYWFTRITGLALAVVPLFTPAANAQIVISNEHLVSTTLVVNYKGINASCQGNYCIATPVPMFKPTHVTCPAAMGKTCTLHIALDAKTETPAFTEDRFQFLLDGKRPVPGPTDGDGFYIFATHDSQYDSSSPAERQSQPASVVGKVTNSQSKNHKIEVSVACTAINYGCSLTVHWSTMRIDVFEP